MAKQACKQRPAQHAKQARVGSQAQDPGSFGFFKTQLTIYYNPLDKNLCFFYHSPRPPNPLNTLCSYNVQLDLYYDMEYVYLVCDFASWVYMWTDLAREQAA